VTGDGRVVTVTNNDLRCSMVNIDPGELRAITL
jgi:hypothetical protein